MKSFTTHLLTIAITTHVVNKNKNILCKISQNNMPINNSYYQKYFNRSRQYAEIHCKCLFLDTLCEILAPETEEI